MARGEETAEEGERASQLITLLAPLLTKVYTFTFCLGTYNCGACPAGLNAQIDGRLAGEMLGSLFVVVGR